MPSIDIYTQLPIETKTQEHVFPAALGGRLTSGEILDRSTNATLGHTIDAALEQAFRTLRLIMGAESAHGEAPRPVMVTGEDGNKYLLSSGGKLELVPSGEIERSNNIYRLQAQVANEAQLRQMLRKKAKESGHDLDELVRKAMALAGDKDFRTPAPPLKFNFSLGADELRATAKIVCNLLAHYEPDIFRVADFNGIRKFVLGDAEQHDWVRPVPFAMRAGLGKVDHLACVVRSETGDVFGLVVYFGHIAFLVRMGTTSRLFAARSYRVDSLGKRQRIDDPVDLCWDLPDWGPRGDMQGYGQTLAAQMTSLLPIAHDIQHGVWLDGIIRPILKRWAEDEAAADGELSDERWHAMAGEVTSAIVHEMWPSIAAASALRREGMDAHTASYPPEDDGPAMP